ncbi:poly-gamma-glutamate synthase PgsB [bacterium]|nr:MAG: poly-gamma-glutamate synthase PgsB [bacterium]
MELFIIILIIALVAWWVIEYGRHRNKLRDIKVRVHVNGTRGKSSVTRLIAGALREGGYRTVAKTTGTLPRFVFPDGSEEPIVRLGPPNIHEQVGIVRRAAQMGADALVVECMALQPEYQEISERKIIQSSVGVITNARPDHLDVMGPTDEDVVDAISGTIPPGGICFTAEKERFERLRKNAEIVGARIIQTDPGKISDKEMEGFSYIEHKENVALALAVALHFGVPRDKAIRGMQIAKPDFGALRVFHIEFFDKRTVFYNAFAANDPESTGWLWDMLGLHPSEHEPIIVIANNRADRPSRTLQLAKMLHGNVRANNYILVGTNTKLLWEELGRAGIDMANVQDMGSEEVEDIFEQCMELTPRSSIIVGVGNIGGIGREIVRYFEARAESPVEHDDSADGV